VDMKLDSNNSDEAAYLKSEVFSIQHHAMSFRHDSLIEFDQLLNVLLFILLSRNEHFGLFISDHSTNFWFQ